MKKSLLSIVLCLPLACAAAPRTTSVSNYVSDAISAAGMGSSTPGSLVVTNAGAATTVLSNSVTTATVNATSVNATTLTGNGSGLTNLAAVARTPYVSGALYTNSSADTKFVTGVAFISSAKIGGTNQIDLKVGPLEATLFTVDAAGGPTDGTGGSVSAVRQKLSGFVPSGWIFTFTNSPNNVGSGNTIVFPDPGTTNTVTTLR
jgi:hypothetical protein